MFSSHTVIASRPNLARVVAMAVLGLVMAWAQPGHGQADNPDSVQVQIPDGAEADNPDSAEADNPDSGQADNQDSVQVQIPDSGRSPGSRVPFWQRGQERFLYASFDFRGSSAPDGTFMFEMGANVGKSIRPNVSLAIELSGNSAPLLGGNRGAFSILPSAEGFYFLGPVQAYGRLGFGAQYRGGARLAGTEALGLFAALGSRVRLGRCRGNGPHNCFLIGCYLIGLEVRLHHATHKGWLMHPAVLPQGASILSTGFSIGFEL